MPADKVIGNMQALVEVHETLNELAKEKTKHLVNGDMKALEGLMKREEAAAAKLEELERQRSQWVDQLLAEKGIVAEEPTMTDLLKFVDEEEKLKLMNVQQSLLEEIAALKQQNSLNQELIKQSLQYVNVSLNLLDPRTESPNYKRPVQNSKKQELQNGRSLFDSKA